MRALNAFATLMITSTLAVSQTLPAPADRHRSEADCQQAECAGGEDPVHREAVHDPTSRRGGLVAGRQADRLRLEYQRAKQSVAGRVLRVDGRPS